MKDYTGFKYKKLTAIEPTKERKDGCVIWKCQCDCGNIVYIKGSDLASKRKGSCGCLEKENQKTFGKRVDNSKDITNQRFGRLIALYPTEKRSGSCIVWHCKCDCGNEKDISIGNLGKRVFSCGCLQKEISKENGKELIIDLKGQKFGKLTVIEYVNMPDKKGSYWKCKCECGNEIIVSSKNLIHKATFSCGCLKESHGEYLIRKLLEENNVKYIKEYKVDVGYKSGYPARFDFYIENLSKYYFIEYDGEQHYKNTGYGTVEDNQFKDKIKNQWCKNNNISLIRIPYYHLDELKIEDLLLETSNYIVN